MPDIKAPTSVQAAARRAYGTPKHGRQGYGSAGEDDGPRDPVDAVRIQGLNPRAYPEEVQAVLADLMAQIDHLHREVDLAVGRQGWLEELADQDAVLPVFNRRAFLREVDAFLESRPSGDLAATDAPPAPGALALFYLHNFEALHRNFGLAAADEALSYMARTIQLGVRSTDIIGAVGGAGVAVLLSLVHQEAAQVKIDALRTALVSGAASHDGKLLPLQVVAVMAMVEEDGTASAQLEELDGVLRSALSAADRP